MKSLILICLLMALAPLAFADDRTGDFFFDPHVAVGFNSAQGTHFMLGADGGMHIDENLSAGLGAYFSAGEHPGHDREFGVGPFAAYTYPFANFLVGQLRQEVNYVDLYYPIKTVNPATGEVSYDHVPETGVAAVTSASLTFYFTSHFVLSGGYRFVMALSNSALDDDRSGAFLGFAIGI